MKKQIKRSIYAGQICQTVVYQKRERELRMGHCAQTRLRFANEEEREEHRRKISLNRFLFNVNAAFSSAGYFGTLTFDSHQFPNVDYETAKKQRDNFIRRIKRAYPDAVLALVIGVGDNGGRFHIHMLIEGVDHDKIADIWGKGYVHLTPLRGYGMHNGQQYDGDYSCVARYMFDQAIAEPGQHRYYISRNADKPEVMDPEVCEETYTLTKYPEEPGYEPTRAYADLFGNLYFWYLKKRIPI